MSIHAYSNKKGETLYRFTFRLNGKQITRRGFLTKKEARNNEASERVRLQSSTTREQVRLTLSQYLDKWHGEDVKAIRKMGAYHHKRTGQYLTHLKKEIGHIKIHALQPRDLILFREKYQREQRLANRTIRSIESCLKGALKDAVHLNYINKNPLEHFKILRLGLNDKQEIEVFEKEEQDVLLRSAQSYSEKLKDPRWFIRIYIALQTGMRAGEIAGLQWGDFDFINKTVHVKRTVDYAAGDTQGVLKEPKTKSSLRTIYLTDSNVREIEKYKVWVSEKLLKVSNKVVASTPFLFDVDLGVLHRSASRRRWETILKQAGLKHRGFHSLRHTHASNLISQNVNMKYISERLGHSSIMVTIDIYGHCFQDDSRNQIEKALNYLEGKKH